MKIGFGLVTTFHAHAGEGKALAEIILEAGPILEGIPSCLEYFVGVSEEAPDRVTVFEMWTDEGHHKASLDNKEIRAVIQRAEPLIREINQSEPLEMLGDEDNS
ncbi:putative quinol monooxygenase [Listeria costaricensis]|uniref:putative quinol monooxygenase n=1 Tax=Listeria costaricensis TaxID=2026604 RepID=UPI000C074F11|nr:antibiotic biosynthesis monooxygenase family protein [Listeria costaricensis]